MSDVDIPKPSGNFITGKLGPLPVWAWGAILGVGVLGFYLLRNRASSTPAGDTTDGSALDTVADPWTGPTTGVSNAAPVNPGSSSGSPTDNQSWLNLAISGTANALSASPSAVSSVLSRYLYDGGSFSTKEQTYIDQAIKLYGAPPQGTGASSSFPGTSTTAPVAGSSGGGTGALAQNPYTFTQNSKGWRIVNANTGKSLAIKSSADKDALKRYVGAIGRAGSVANVGSSDVMKYINGLA